MRIIAGDYKGRKLVSPADESIRPTSDKVKEALFSILGENVIGACCCDLFSGTGNLGLEALSRGADKCYFCDNSARSISLLTENIDKIGAGEYAIILQGNYKACIDRMDEKADIFFLDPPYDRNLWTKAISKIIEADKLNAGGIIVCEHRKENVLPENISGLSMTKQRYYGKVVLSFFM